MNRPLFTPPAPNAGFVQPLSLFGTADIVTLAAGAGLALSPDTDPAEPAALLNQAFSDFAAGEGHTAASSSPAEIRDWLTKATRICRDLFTVIGEGKEGVDGAPARRALKAPERHTPDYSKFARLVFDATPSENSGATQSWHPMEGFDAGGIEARYRFLLEMALPAALQAIVIAAEAEQATLAPAIRRGRMAVPHLGRRFLFNELGQAYAAAHDLSAARRRGAPGKEGWHRAVIVLAASRTDDEAIHALASWARGNRQGRPIPSAKGDELRHMMRLTGRDKIANTPE